MNDNERDNVGINENFNPNPSVSNRIKNKIRAIYCNLSTAIKTGFSLCRDKNIVLIGAWGGAKFADNSRYLYQYLFDNKEKLGLKKVIWVTRSNVINTELRDMGYESYLCGTKESDYYHLKAGIHIVCNSSLYGYLLPDIDTKYSFGAKKIQLWHGAGMKAVGIASNSNKSTSKDRRIAWRKKHENIIAMGTYGAWNKEFFLSTSKINADVNYKISEISRKRMFISSYPRNCKCLRLTEKENEIINEISKYNGALLYLPTFRDPGSEYIHPLENITLCNLLKQHKWVWIEKPHTADNNLNKFRSHDCPIIELKPDFDINVLYEHVQGMISDYSSAIFDGAYRGIATIMYTPDLEEFRNGSVGFLFDVEEYCKSIISRTPDSLVENVTEIMDDTYLTKDRLDTLNKIRMDFFDNRESNYEQIWQDIVNARA